MASKVIKLHNTQAEREVLNAIMLNPYIYDFVADIISRDIFQDPESAMVYDLISKQVREGKMIDAAEIFGILSNKGIDISHYLFDMPLASELTRQRIQYLDDLCVRTKLLAAMYKGQAMVTDTTITREQLRDITKEVDGLLDNDVADDAQAGRGNGV
jgi:replicative DNA helicase